VNLKLNVNSAKGNVGLQLRPGAKVKIDKNMYKPRQAEISKFVVQAKKTQLHLKDPAIVNIKSSF